MELILYVHLVSYDLAEVTYSRRFFVCSLLFFGVCVSTCRFFGIFYVDTHAVCKQDNFISSFFNLYVFCFPFLFYCKVFQYILYITIIGVIILVVCVTSFYVPLSSSVYNCHKHFLYIHLVPHRTVL